ncbi:Glycosyltransferase involved in cell wall bisynthesis [Paenibacillus tianmuensis]|uniref:Glycosyltransferase involved in cell wall bisynthesis n=1 Tax=Paenibacillus tianmuensis TaxID=624147 RepID=A0A1G4RNW8_9BACL|nr:glycosyltransferase [Paenibacillus tianmuensis]SCW58584.1 Glycosyltransferase involved in cell wall bisynthesis [Paenibacillus tianmuensis]
MLVSVCMIVRDEECNIERALQSIPDSYEKIVVDTGSKDATVEIANRNGAVVKYFDWIQDYSAARNYSMSFASGQYILILDADEVLADHTEQQIREFVEVFPGKAGTVSVENWIKDEWHTHRSIRLFPNDVSTFYYQGKVHETLCQQGKDVLFENTGVTIYHYGYEEELYQNGGKAQRYLDLYQQCLLENPDDGYMLYQLGKLYFSIGEKERALDALERCLAVNEQNNLYYPVMLVMLGYILKDIGQSKLAEELLEPFTNVYMDYPDIFFLLGLLAMDTGRIREIEAYFSQAIKIGETKKYSSVKGVGSFKAAYNLGVYYEVTGNREMAIKHYRQSAQHEFHPAIERLQNLKKP